MGKYLAFFRLRFSMGLQYRAAAVAGIVTQFFWGAMELLAFRAFYDADPAAFPMAFQATASYVWMQQAFLALFGAWFFENEIFQSMPADESRTLLNLTRKYLDLYRRKLNPVSSEAEHRNVPSGP